MPLYLTEADVESLVSPTDAVGALHAALERQARGEAYNQPRRRLIVKPAVLHVLTASVPPALGLKAYISTPERVSPIVLVFHTETGTLDAIVEASRLGQLRTGAASVVASRWLARADSHRVGLLGSGYQAWGQIEAFAAAYSLSAVKVYSRQKERCQAFANRVEQALGVSCKPCDSPTDVCQDIDILVTATSARDPLVGPELMHPGLHVNAVGINRVGFRELSPEAVLKCRPIVVDDIEQAHKEAGDLLPMLESGALAWTDLVQLCDVVAGHVDGRKTDSDITLFKSLGIGLEDIAVGEWLYQKALSEGRGQRLGAPGSI